MREETAHRRPERGPLSPRSHPPRPGRAYLGHAQLSLVEHALCPLDATSSLGGPLIHEASYWFSDLNRHRKQAHARVLCPEGLSPSDEFYLWGLLSLTFSQENPTVDFHATPYYCLRRLGCIDAHANRGGKNYELFRSAIDRLAAVTYRNDLFYDPIRGEHRQVSFGFLSYSLPLDPQSSRAWRFAWDPIFFEFCSAARGALLFDFQAYRALDEASRRLFLLLKKVFWRNAESPDFDLHDLAVHAIGFSPTQEPRHLKRKLLRCIERLLASGILCLPTGIARPADLFAKRAKGRYSIRLHRGPHFDHPLTDAMHRDVTESPLFEILTTIGLDRPAIRHILAAHDPRLIAEIADMTLAARERFGESFFTKSPAAYFMDNLTQHAKGKRTAPDWWRAVRTEEERRRRQAERPTRAVDDHAEKAFRAYLETEARDAFERVMDRVFQSFRSAGQSDEAARRTAHEHAQLHFRHLFFKEHPEYRGDGPSRFGDILSSGC
jgi:hypothetical protein